MTRKPSRKSKARRSVEVRGYRKADLAACRRLWEELVEKHREIYADPSIGGDDPGSHFDGHLKRVGPGRIWVAVEGDEVLGFVGLVVEGEDAEIEPLIVTRERRGSGIGGLLAGEAMAAARDLKGVKFLTVRPVARNKEALDFFHGLGLVNVGRIEIFEDLTGREWRKGLRMHGLDYRY
jgi:ribosomal protein S18 acetylase RimI-like enzyme